MSFESELKKKNDRLNSIPEQLLTVAEKQQKKLVNEALLLLSELDIKAGQIVISKSNLQTIQRIMDDLKQVYLSDEYLKAVKEFAGEFDKQAVISGKLIGLEESVVAADVYITNAKKSTIDALIGSGASNKIFAPIQAQIEQAVVNGASLKETILGLQTFIEGNDQVDSKVSRYIGQVAKDSFAIADRSYTSILADYLDSEWFYYSGSETQTTRCFCEERVGKNFYYKEIESWGDGENLGKCNIGGGKWAGMIEGTNSSTIYSYLGGYNCTHSLIPVSEAFVSDSEKKRAEKFGYKNN